MNRLITPGDTRALDAFLADNPDIQYLDAFFFDLCGHARGKRYPRRDIAKVFRRSSPVSTTVSASAWTRVLPPPATPAIGWM